LLGDLVGVPLAAAAWDGGLRILGALVVAAGVSGAQRWRARRCISSYVSIGQPS